MKILVTGGMGFIGSHTVVELIKAKHEVEILDNLYNSNINVLSRIEKITGVRPVFHEVDILDKESLDKTFKDGNYDAIIHFAGYKAVGESCKLPLVYYQNNIAGSLNIYEMMLKYAIKNIVFSSSATVYGDNFKVPFKEEYGLGDTTNPYGSSKKFNEIILTDIVKANPELSCILLRYFNPIGAHESGLIGEVPNGIPNNLLPYIAKVADGKLDYLNIFGDDYDTIDGTGVRDYIHVVDLAKAHVLAIEYASRRCGVEVINVGSGKGYSVLEVLHAYEKASGKKIPYKIVERRSGDIATCFADVKKAKELLGFEVSYDIDKMCFDSYNFIKNNPDGIK